MYIQDISDKELLKSLMKAREIDEAKMQSGELNDTCHFGLTLTDMFKDIHPSISFLVANKTIYIKVDRNELPYHGEFLSKEATYGNFADMIKIKLDVVERLRLIRQLEDSRMGIWVFSAQQKVDIDALYSDKLCYIDDPDDVQYISKHLEDSFVATKELKHFIENDFKSDDEVRYKWTMRLAWISIAVALLSAFEENLFNLFQ